MVPLSRLGISPNPNGGLLFIDGIESGARTMTIHDLGGAVVLTARSSTVLNVSSLAAGTYILVIRDQQGIAMARAPFIRE
ncbi:MAG: T9SS type A sorting domain-containing protein [Flavobacteriales bacterium]|nr:T9SS type A sorting domain-containing protein [Flavobacteriales bacterium]